MQRLGHYLDLKHLLLGPLIWIQIWGCPFSSCKLLGFECPPLRRANCFPPPTFLSMDIALFQENLLECYVSENKGGDTSAAWYRLWFSVQLLLHAPKGSWRRYPLPVWWRARRDEMLLGPDASNWSAKVNWRFSPCALCTQISWCCRERFKLGSMNWAFVEPRLHAEPSTEHTSIMFFAL